MMSNKLGFGRDAEEFLRARGCDCSEDAELLTHGARITAITPLGNERITVRVTVANQYGSESLEFVLMREHSEELGLKIGGIDEEVLPELEYYAEVARAYGSACASFAYTYASYAVLFQKLLQKGFAKDVAEDAIESVKLRGFVNEEEIAIRRSQVLAEKHWGRARIVMKLREEGFDGAAMYAVSCQLDGFDFVDSCAALIKKKYKSVPPDGHKKELMYASLMRMGFSSAEIRDAMKTLR